MNARRYQLKKDVVAIVGRGHPWIFRDQLSTAAHVLRDGELLRLVDGDNRVVGFGTYEAEGAIAIRVLRRGSARPDAAWLRGQLERAIAKRSELAASTDGIRLVHGESDGIPAVVADRFGPTVAVASYSPGSSALALYAARWLAANARQGATAALNGIANVVVRPVHRRRGASPAPRVVCGSAPEVASFTEDGIEYAVDLAAGHKTGAYLDLRGLRRAIAQLPLAGARVLNLFAYTGMLGRAAEAAGAAEIVQVDVSQRALDFAAAHHVVDPAKHRLVAGDVLDWLPALDPAEVFDLVIVDPPSMTSRMSQVPRVLAAYRKLYRAAARHVRPGGTLVAACCTSRVARDIFDETLRSALSLHRIRDIPPELDHPVTFPQADYLKISLWT